MSTKPTSVVAPATVKRSRGGTQPLPLTREEILDAALPLLERVGVDALTVRSVAGQLGITSPAVYHYFDGRDDLVDRLCELVAAQVEIEVAPDTAWDDAVVEIVLNMDRTFARYPGVAARVLGSRRHSPAANLISGNVHAHLLRGGFDAERAEEVHAALHCLFGGWLLGKRPMLAERTTDRAVLERSVRWLLHGAGEPAG
jgi:TetR/AcrR family tetracycline transcriptional repressor